MLTYIFFVNTYIFYMDTQTQYKMIMHAHKCLHCAGIEPAPSCAVGIFTTTPNRQPVFTLLQVFFFYCYFVVSDRGSKTL
jgi:hypothetical protein